jgi:hypothetical protein
MFGLQRWKAGTMLATWVAYWAALVGVTLGSGLLGAWRLTRTPGSHGTMSASFDNGKLLFTVNDAVGAGAWSFGTSVAAAVAWIAVPPLALWVLWLMSRPRRAAQQPAAPAMLGAAPMGTAGRAGASAREARERLERPS